MISEKITGRIVFRYFCIQLIGTLAFILVLILVRRWIELPFWLFVSIAAVWIVKDMILFPFVWRAYDWDREEKTSPMVGMQGIVQQRLDPTGYIQVRGELWQATVADKQTPVDTGKAVRVTGIKGLMLFVEPE
jgi:membrane-bound ClpP family serine protease